MLRWSQWSKWWCDGEIRQGGHRQGEVIGQMDNRQADHRDGSLEIDCW